MVLLGLTLALLATVVYLVYVLRISPTAIRFVPSRTQIVTNTVTQIAVRKINATNLLAALASLPLNWSAIESTNYISYINNLRAFGCPEETIRDIIITDVAKNYARRRAEIRARVGGYRFWQTSDTGEMGETIEPAIQQQLAALEHDQSTLVRELLGVDFNREIAKYVDDQEYEERAYGFLAGDKRHQVIDLQTKYEHLEQQIYGRSKGFLLDEDQEALRRLQKERDAEMAKVLTPEELEEYQLRNSPTASALRAQLHGFSPSEEEFRRIFRLQKTFDDQFNNGFDLTDDSQAELRAQAQETAQRALDEEIRKAVGPQRFAEYQRAQDADYKALLQFTERFDTSPVLATRVYDMKVEAERQKLRLESNPNLTPEQRNQALIQIAQEAERSVAQLMGGANSQLWVAYQRAGGQWIRNLGDSDLALQTEIAVETQANTAPAPVPSGPPPAPFFVLPPPPPGFPGAQR